MVKKRLGWEEKAKLVGELEAGDESVTAVCQRWRVSRPCAYKWWRRYQALGLEGLRERSRRPRNQPRRISVRWRERIAAARERYPRWGGKKLRVLLRREHPRVRLPAVSTIGAELRRAGLARGRPRRLLGSEVMWPVRQEARRVHDVWTVDFKGWFRTGDGQRCEPLTVRDLHSRYGLCAQVLGGTTLAAVQLEFKKIFRQHGLPKVIHTDQGVPFAGGGPAMLARLSAWWVSLGIRPEFSRRARPGDNAAHEQWHRVMKAETANPPAQTRAAQQQRQNRWLRGYNQERPHEALGQRVPAQLYHPSARPYRGVLPPNYPQSWLQRKVRGGGEISWQGRRRFLGESFAGFRVGLKVLSPQIWGVYFYHLLLGELYANDQWGLRSARYRRPSTKT